MDGYTKNQGEASCHGASKRFVGRLLLEEIMMSLTTKGLHVMMDV